MDRNLAKKNVRDGMLHVAVIVLVTALSILAAFIYIA